MRGSFGVFASGCSEDLTSRRKSLDLLADDVNSTVVRGVQLKDLLAEILWAKDFAGEREDRTRFTRAGRAVQQEVG